MKRRLLIQAGLPAAALTLVTVRNGEGRRHSVLIVATSQGDMILDHHTSNIVKRRDSAYSFASVEAVRFFE